MTFLSYFAPKNAKRSTVKPLPAAKKLLIQEKRNQLEYFVNFSSVFWAVPPANHDTQLQQTHFSLITKASASCTHFIHLHTTFSTKPEPPVAIFHHRKRPISPTKPLAFVHKPPQLWSTTTTSHSGVSKGGKPHTFCAPASCQSTNKRI